MNVSTKSLLRASTSCLMLALAVSAAQAQSVDYSALQQTFGEPVTMSATGKPQRASDVPADMIIVTHDQIRQSGAQKLADVLKFVPGLDVRTYGDSNAEVNVHGYLQPVTPRLLVLINGRQVYLDHYGYVDWNTLPVQLSEIQQIEIVKGPGSSLFGFNAYSGVINIITIDPSKTKKAELQITAGTYGVQNYNAVISEKLTDTIAVKASGGYSTQEAYHFAFDPLMMQTAAERPSSMTAALDLRWQALDNVQVTTEATWAKSRQYELSAVGGFMNMRYTTYSYKMGVAADTEFGLINFNAYRNHMAHKILMWGLHSIWYNDVTVLSANDLFKIGNDVTVRLAAEFRDNMSNVDMTEFGSASGKVATRVYSGSAMVDWAITPELSFTNSFRFDSMEPRFSGAVAANVKKTTDTISFNSGLVWKATDADTFRVLGGRSVQTPSLVLLYNYPTLKPSSLMKAEASWDHAFRDISSNLHVAIYQQWASKMLANASANIGNSSSMGLEATFSGANEAGWRWNGSLNWRNVKDNITFVPKADYVTFVFDGYSLNFESTTPKYVATFGLGKTWGDFEIDLTGKWVSKSKDWHPTMYAASFVDVPDYLTTTLRVGYRLNDNFTLAVTAAQLNKETVYEGTFVPDKRRFMVTLTASL